MPADTGTAQALEGAFTPVQVWWERQIYGDWLWEWFLVGVVKTR